MICISSYADALLGLVGGLTLGVLGLLVVLVRGVR